MGSRGAGGLPGRSPSNSWGSWRPSAARSCGDGREECGSTARPMGEPTGCPTGGPTGTHRMSHWSPIGCPTEAHRRSHWTLWKPHQMSHRSPVESHWSSLDVPLKSNWSPLGVPLEPPGSHWSPTGCHAGAPRRSHQAFHWSPLDVLLGARWMSYWESIVCLTGGPPGVQLDIPLEPTADPIRCSTGAHWRSHWRPLEAPLDDVPSEASGGAIR